jgi:hypothetical protein
MERLKARMQERLAARAELGAPEGGERTRTDDPTGSLQSPSGLELSPLRQASIRSLRSKTMRGKELEALARARDGPGLLRLDRWCQCVACRCWVRELQ